jgi:hypothetical protein
MKRSGASEGGLLANQAGSNCSILSSCSFLQPPFALILPHHAAQAQLRDDLMENLRSLTAAEPASIVASSVFDWTMRICGAQFVAQ